MENDTKMKCHTSVEVILKKKKLFLSFASGSFKRKKCAEIKVNDVLKNCINRTMTVYQENSVFLLNQLKVVHINKNEKKGISCFL